MAAQSKNGLPTSWASATLRELVRVRNGYAFSSKDYKEEGVLLVRQTNLREDRVSLHNAVYLPRDYLVKHPEFAINKGDILVGMSGSIGKICIYEFEEPALQNQRTGLLEFYEPLTKQYVRYYFLTLARYFEELAKGIAVQNISAKEIESAAVSLPPIPEQHRIVAKIEELFTDLDAGVTTLKQIQIQLKRYRQSVLKAAFEGKLTEGWLKQNAGSSGESGAELLQRIQEERKKKLGSKYKEPQPIDTSGLPELLEGWAWGGVSSVGTVETGTTPSKAQPEFYGRDFPFYKPTDLNAGYYTRDSTDGLSKKGIGEARFLPEKSTLVTCIGATIGKIGFIRTAGASNQQINAIVPDPSLVPEYLYWATIAPIFQKQILENASATTLPILNKKKFETLALPFPSIPQQQLIVQELERCFSVADAIEKTVDCSVTQSERLRQSILKKAFEGKLVPQDASDEPADKLLEGISLKKEIMGTGSKVKPLLKK